MAEINRTNVAQAFMRICGLLNVVSYNDMISRSIRKISDALTVDELTEDQAASCEYAAACEAAYEYTLEEASCERLVQSEKGSIRRGAADPLTVEGAEALRKHAYADLAGIARLGGFVFETVKESGEA